MPVDIRATVSCSLGTPISGNISDEYVQGTGLIKCTGSVVISGIITPAIGTAVTFTYTKGGITRSIPRKLRVLSSFADPFRRTTSVELGCKLTYLSDKKDSIDWTAFDDTENTLTTDDAKIITIPIRAQAVAEKCLDELGITGTFTLTNKFSIEKFDLSPGYVQVLSDLLVSESLCGYLDEDEELQVFSLDQAGGTGPVLDATQLVDIGKIGVGQLPGEAVVVSYSSLKLKRDVNQGDGSGNSPWEKLVSTSSYFVDIAYGNAGTGLGSRRYNILETTVTTTAYKTITTQSGETKRVVASRQTDLTTDSPAIAGGLIAEYLTNGIGYSGRSILRQTYETFDYDKDGNESFYDRYVRGSFLYLAGSAGVPFVFPDSSYVTINEALTVDLEREQRSTTTVGDFQQVHTTTFAPWFKSIPGQQSIARSYQAFTEATDVVNYLNSIASGALAVVDDRVEVQRKSDAPSVPTAAEVNNANNAKGGNPTNGYRTESKAQLELVLGSATAQRRIEFSLPYAPDDTFFKSGSTYGSTASDAPQKAQLYGQCQNRLLLGNRNGMSIQAAPEILPAAPFSPFVIRSGTTSALYRTNGSSWTFDAQGVVASTDALFWGGVGGNAGQSWFPIAPGITTLPTAPATTTVNITDPSGNVIGSYQQMVVGNTVPIYQETRLLASTLRVRPEVTSLPYALEQQGTIVAALKLKAVIKSLDPFELVSGNASPVLGVGQVTPTSTATDAGWTLAYDDTADEGATEVTGFGFTFTLDGTGYTGCYVNSNGFITFGSGPLAYSGLGAAVPNVPKLHFGSDDFSYQRVYTKITENYAAIRWEGNTSYSAAAGSSNRFAEITFYRENGEGKQYVDVRFGNLGSTTARPFMIATASTALASITGALAENASYVFEGNSDGTTWTAYSAKHVAAT